MKAEKKAAEKEAKVKDQGQQNKETNDQAQANAYGADEETLDPNVSYIIVSLQLRTRLRGLQT